MALFFNNVGFLSKNISKLHVLQCGLDRLCFSRVALLNSRMGDISKRSNHLLGLPQEAISEDSQYDLDFIVRTQNINPIKRFWLDRKRLHLTLENDPDFQGRIFSPEDVKNFVNVKREWTSIELTKESFQLAPLSKLSGFVSHQVNVMGRSDFKEACQHLVGRLEDLGNHELLEIIIALYSVPSPGGNYPLLWNVIDNELLKRLDTAEKNTHQQEFFLAVADLLFWLSLTKSSSFLTRYIREMLRPEHLNILCDNYSQGIQILFYACCVFEDQDLQLKNDQHLISFLDAIKDKCSFPSFLIAAESYCALHHEIFKKSGTKRWRQRIRRDFQYFLYNKASTYIRDESILIPLIQLLDVCQIETHLLQKLISKISNRKQPMSSVLGYHLTQIMANRRIINPAFYEYAEKYLEFVNTLPGNICRILLSFYHCFGPEGMQNLAQRAALELERGGSYTCKDHTILKMFVILMDCGIDASHMWELSMHGEVLLPTSIRPFPDTNDLYLIADDCIEVNCPTYSGSRLGDAMRMHIYFENGHVNRMDPEHPFHSIFKLLKTITKGQVLTSHILPGFSCKGAPDIIVCVDRDYNFCAPEKTPALDPWDVQKIPDTSLERGHLYCAIWSWPRHWSSVFVKLKKHTLQKLGYSSIVFQNEELTSFPAELRDVLIMDKLETFRRRLSRR